MRRAVLLRRAIFGAAFAVAAVVGACTAFNDLVADPTFLGDIDSAARVCTMIATCHDDHLAEAIALSTGIPVADDNFSVCLTWLTAPIPPKRAGVDIQRSLFDCLAAKSAAGATCRELDACMFVRPIDPADAGCDGAQDFCDGRDIVIDCHNNLELTCTSPRYDSHSECFQGAQHRAGCALGGCVPGAPSDSCNDQGEADRCDAVSRVRVLEVCAAQGGTCLLNSKNVASCGDSCSDAVGTARCDSDVVLVCLRATSPFVNCGDIHLGCAEDDKHAVCIDNGDASDCSVFDPSFNRCTGTKLSVCVGGKSASIDCSSYSSAQCVDTIGCMIK